MPKPRPGYQAGQYYHFYNRGRSRLKIFVEESNYIYVIRKMRSYALSNNLSVIAYCLMPNHYHMLIRQNDDSEARLLPQYVFNSYSKAYNKRFNHSGTLFEDSYKAIAVQDSVYLMQLCRYIHANPVKANLVEKLEDWPFSNYLDWIGERQGQLVDREFIWDTFLSLESYKKFVNDYLIGDSLPDKLQKYLTALE